MTNVREFYRRHLPHWQPVGATFFVTFRLKGSLPEAVVDFLREESHRERQISAISSESEGARSDLLAEGGAFTRWDALLNSTEFGPWWLSNPRVAEIVAEALHYRDKKVYDLWAYCLMANHAHVLITPLEQRESSCLPLNRIMQSLKRHTARQANIALGRGGTFWQDESYDHVVRDHAEFARILHYVLENPVQAGLVTRWDEWKWTYCKPDLLP